MYTSHFDYEILGLKGRGTFGQVLKAKWKRNGKEVSQANVI